MAFDKLLPHTNQTLLFNPSFVTLKLKSSSKNEQPLSRSENWFKHFSLLLIAIPTWPGSCRGLLMPWRNWSTLWQQPTPIPRCFHKPPSDCNLFPGKTGWREHPDPPGNMNKSEEINWNRRFIRSSLMFGKHSGQSEWDFTKWALFNIPWSSA